MRERMHTMLEAIARQHRLPKIRGLSWATLFLAVILVVAVVSEISVGTRYRRASIWVIFTSLVFLNVWWVFVVGFFRSAVSPEQLRLLPGARPASFWFVFGTWVGFSWLGSLMFVFYTWFPAVIVAVVLAVSIRNRRYRELAIATLVIASFIIACVVWKARFAGLSISWSGELLVLFLNVGALFAIVGILRAMPLVGGAILLLGTTSVFAAFIFRHELPDVQSVVHVTTMRVMVYLSLDIALMAIFLVGLFGLSLDRMADRRTGGLSFWDQLASSTSGMRRLADWLRRFSIYDHLLRLASVSSSSAERLLGFAFGKVLHWSFAWVLVAFFLFWFVLEVTMNYLWASNDAALRMPEHSAINSGTYFTLAMMTSGLMIRAVSSALSNFTKLYREQQLLSLAPRWPGTPELNRVFAKVMVQYWGAIALVGFIGLAIPWAFLQTDPFRFFQSIAILLSMVGICVAISLQRYSHMDTKPGMSRVLWCVVAAIPVIVHIVHRRYASSLTGEILEKVRANPSEEMRALLEPLFYQTLYMERPIDLVPYAVMLLVVSVFLAWRLRKFLRYPRVLPAGNALA